MTALVLQALHTLLVLSAAPLLTGFVRWLKARLLGRQGPSPIQPYRDLLRLFRKEAVVAHSASWIFRVAPYGMFAALLLAASLVPVFSTATLLAPFADLIVLVGILGTARFLTTLAGLDIGTSFGGLGASREMMIASLAEPAVLMIIFTLSLLIHSTSLPTITGVVLAGDLGLRVSMALALIALVMVAIAECGRIPIDNPATHLELTMVHEAMVLEYSGRHLALVELTGQLRLLFYVALIGAIFAPWGIGLPGAGLAAVPVGLALFFGKLLTAGALLAVFETSVAKMRVFRVSEFLGGALLLGLLATIFLYFSRG